MVNLLGLLFPFMEFSVYGEKYAKILAKKFSPFFHLPCYLQFGSINTSFWDYFVKLLILKCLRPYETEKLLVTIVVPKLQSLILGVTRRDDQLEHFNVPNVPISPRNPKKKWITKLLRSTAPQNLMSPWSVNFVNKSFLDFTFYVNIETLKTECRLDQEQKMWLWSI